MFRHPVNSSVAASGENRLFVGAIIVASAASSLPLYGWLTDRPVLQGMGFVGVPGWPVTSVVNLLLTLAALLSHRSWHRAARGCLLPCLAAAGLSLAQYVSGLDFGIDQLLLPADIAARGIAKPGRMGVVAIATVLMLSACIALMNRRERRAEQLVLLLTSGVIGFAAMSIAALLLHIELAHRTIRLTSSLPTAVAALALSVALLADRPVARPEPAPSYPSVSQWHHARAFFPAVVAAFVVLPLMLQAAGTAWLVTREMTAFLSAVGNLVIVAALLSWARRSIRREQRALADVSRALDAAAILMTRGQETIVHWSRGCEALLGWPASDAIGRSSRDLLAWEPMDLADAHTPGGGRAWAVWAHRRNGAKVPLIVHSQLLESRGAASIYVHAIADISSRLRVESALRESELKLAQAIEAHDLGVFEWNVVTDAIAWSPGAEERLGLRPGTIINFASWRAQVDPADAEIVLGRIAEVRATRAERLTFRYRLLPAGGPPRMIEGSGRCFYAQDQLVRVIGVNIDVTAQEQREAALQAGQAQLRSILDTVPDAMIVIDDQGGIQNFSAAAERMFGYAAADVVGKNVSLLMPRMAAATHDGHITRYLATGERRALGYARSLTARRADGSEIAVELNLGEVWAGGRHIFIGFLHDLSPRIAAEERLERLRSEYAHSARLTAMGEMAASLAHELNQPLTAVANFLGTAEILLKQGSERAQIGDLLSMASGQSLRAGEIIRRMREFLARSEIDVRAEPVEDSVREAIALAMIGTQQLQIGVQVSIDDEADWVLADRIQVQQVLVNLLRNAAEAVRHCPPDRRTITISAHAAGDDMIELAVADRGPGIPAEMIGRLFDPFSSTKGNEGMGLGLRICRRIVEAHSGTMRAENSADGGARLSFTLQRARARQTAREM